MTCQPLSAEAAEFYDLIKDYTPAQLRVVGMLINLLEIPHGDHDLSDPLEAQKYTHMLLVIMRDDVFRSETQQEERDVIAKHIAACDRHIAELEGAQS